MNIEEAKQKLHNMAYRDLQTKPYDLKLADVIQILNQIKLDKPQPEIPQFVADYIDDMHKNARTLRYAFKYMESNIKMHKWCVFERQETFVNAFLYGYTIKKEKLYIVEIPNPKNGIAHRHIMLVKTTDGRVVLSEVVDSHIHLRDDLRLTESEIRKDFDWAWREEFPKEVNE